MKKIFTLLTTMMLMAQAEAQVILNEIYCVPGNARHEFFELFNNSPSSSPVTMDNYTLITYYEEPGNVKGFYVMDLPNIIVASKGYFVGAAAIPFNYQGISNSTAAHFNWNDAATLAANNGYLKKWVLSGSNLTDGNANYDLATIPANFNDFFTKIGGGNASYNAFLYKDGVLVNSFLGGTGGSSFIPTYIVAMPNLFVDMAGSVSDFTINFSGYGSIPAEFVIQEAGTDNGYIRLRDGFCGSWTKSSADVNHTPGTTNGGDATVFTPTISVAAVVVRGNAVNGSTVTYDVVGAPVTSLPITLQIYADNGIDPGKLDGTDTYITSTIETAVNDGSTTTTFFPYTANILIVVVTNSGCIDRILSIPNVGVLPVSLAGFNALATARGNELSWTLLSNEDATTMVVERSMDGVQYNAIQRMPATLASGKVDYRFTDAAAPALAYYRIRIADRAGKDIISPARKLEQKTANSEVIRILGNPVQQQLQFTYVSPVSAKGIYRITSLTGQQVTTAECVVKAGANAYNVSLPGSATSGMYLIEFQCGAHREVVKFMKQ